MTTTPLVKRSFRLEFKDHDFIKARLQPGDLSALVRLTERCVADMIREGKIEDVILFINQQQPITLDPKGD